MTLVGLTGCYMRVRVNPLHSPMVLSTSHGLCTRKGEPGGLGSNRDKKRAKAWAHGHRKGDLGGCTPPTLETQPSRERLPHKGLGRAASVVSCILTT